jgi:2,5-diketo-D-gluconate reductase A
MAELNIPDVVLNDGSAIPQLGVGVFLLPPNETEAIVSEALAVGYRHIDTAAMYQNEAEVGRAIAKSGVERADLYITTKVKNTDHGFDSVQRAIEQSLEELQLDYLDLYLMHWPAPLRGLYVETWLGMEAAVASGKVRSIGVCNFLPEHLDAVLAAGQIVPAVNQIELHPAFQQPELRAYHAKHGILTEAWGPLGQNKYQLSSLPGLNEIAERHGKSVHQVTLRWHLQLGNIVFPKTRSPERLKQNLDVFDFELTAEDMVAIAKLDVAFRLGNNPHFRS